mmetsp:Transcript_12973/g.27617  ORF Transcript_12973/g.27617 Transcript_12973/m.27617 type:complete len:620 (+) Transcript_12973:67-1926(+)
MKLVIISLISAVICFHFPLSIGGFQLQSNVVSILQCLQKRNYLPPAFQLSAESSEDGAPDFDTDDWREFRARLVMRTSDGEATSDDIGSSHSTNTWAYDSGYLIEPGSIILAKVDPDFCYFGLNQQYFHKSVMLVTHHNENSFTKGIILNRPTNLFLGDEDFLNENGDPFILEGGRMSERKNESNEWRIWYGGDVHGLYSDDPEIICLHSVRSELGRNVSQEVMKNVMLTNYQGARQIVDAGDATSSDFWVFAGYAGWTSGQLLDELKRESWYMVSADSQTVWSELVRQRDEESDPRNVGLTTWSMLMRMIGREGEAQHLSDSFADLTLKEWAADTILFNSSITFAEIQDGLDESGLINSVDKLVRLAIDAKEGKVIGAGSILRGSSADSSPFLLWDQKFHKSVVLVLQDDDDVTIGVLLNHPTTRSHPLTLPNGQEVHVTVRYGGSYGLPFVTDQPVVFLHAKQELKDRDCGEPVGNSDPSHIWICSDQQAAGAISKGYANQHDFMAVQGFSIWNKEDENLLGDVLDGSFEVVSQKNSEQVWSILMMQEILSHESIDRNFQLSLDAWSVEGKKDNLSSRFVYESTVSVADLSDDASRFWIEAVLLGKIVSVRKYSAFE